MTDSASLPAWITSAWLSGAVAAIRKRTTAILATLFFATAIGLTILSELDRSTSGILDGAITTDGGAPISILDELNALQAPASDLPVPVTETAPINEPAPAAEAAPAAAPDASGDLPVPEAPAETPAAPATN